MSPSTILPFLKTVLLVSYIFGINFVLVVCLVCLMIVSQMNNCHVFSLLYSVSLPCCFFCSTDMLYSMIFHVLNSAYDFCTF